MIFAAAFSKKVNQIKNIQKRIIMKKYLPFVLLLVLTSYTAVFSQDKVNLTFQVDMTQVESASDVQVVIKDIWIWTALTDQGNGIWSGTAEVDANGTYVYTFVNGGQDNWGGEESVPESCNFGAADAPERHITVGTDDATLNPVEYGGCYTNVGVSLRVNLSEITDMHEGGSVWVLMDPNWDEYYTMTDEDGDGVYTFMIDREVGTTLTYRFSYQTGPDEWNDFTEETLPETCADENGFRTMEIPAKYDASPAFAYGSCGETAVPKVNITFQVDMSTVDNPNDVQVVIKDPWIWTALTDDGNGMWTATVEVDANNTYPYTFVNGGQDNWDGEETVPQECNDGEEDAPERHITVGEENVVIDPVSYGMCTLATPGMVNITFQVDMSSVENPNDVHVVIKDPWIWTALTDNGDGMWTGTVEVEANNTYPYTFVNGGQDNWGGEETVPQECNDGEEDSPERHITVGEENVVIDPVSFGMCTLATPLMVSITFQVDMSVVDNPDDVQVVIKDPWIWTALTDNGDGMWTGTVEVETNNTYPYTFVNGGQDNWDGEESVPEECNAGTESAPERHVTVVEEDFVIDAVSFGMCSMATSVVNLTTENNIEVYPNPASEFLQVFAGDHTILSLSLIDATGRIVKRFDESSVNDQFRIDISDFENGIYFLRFEGRELSEVKKILIQK